jgi:hypothetical protein
MAGRPPYSHKPLPEDRPVNKDDQVLDLLNAVSQRLIASEKERAALKDTVTRLAARADRVEGQVQQQTAKIDKAAAMTDRIEEAIAQQGRMNRRLDKMHHERVQMIRKLERIEETVIETQEALHSKALVLLTDQNVAGGSGKPHLPADTNLAAPPKAGETPRTARPRCACPRPPPSSCWARCAAGASTSCRRTGSPAMPPCAPPR